MSSANVSPPTVATFSGLASGINSSAIISNIVAFAQQPITQLQNQDTTYNTQLSAYQQFNTTLGALQTAANTLALPSTFTANSATSSNPAVATITASSGAKNGTYNITVNQLAEAQQVVSNAYTNDNLGLQQTGSFTINGDQINVTAGDSLNSIASKINAANSGVTAQVVVTGVNQYQLSLTSNNTGTAATISAVDVSGNVLHSLGINNGSLGVRQAVGSNGAASIVTTSASTPLGQLFGYASGQAPSGTFTISNGNGASGQVSVNFNSDSLSAIAGKINAAGITGISAQVVSLPDANGNAGAGGQQLVITNSAGGGDSEPVFTDSSNSILGQLGVLQTSTTGDNQPVAAEDANFTFNGLTYTRSGNTVGDLVSGATVTLLQQTPAAQEGGSTPTPATSTLNISQDTSSVVSAIQNFASAYNNVIDFINTQNQFTTPTNTNTGQQASTQPLFGSQVLSNVESKLTLALGAATGTTTLGSIGVSVDPSTGELDVDTNQLTTALQNNSNSVQSLFGVIGTSTNPNVQYVSSGSSTVQSGGGGYAVNVTTPATQSTATSTVAQTSASTLPETLTFSGLNFPDSIAITLNPGNTLQDTVNQINGDSQLNGTVTAGINGSGQLVINSTAYGSSTGFTVTSNLAASSNDSGLGFAPTFTNGTDVAGTINGESATGSGQTLVGNAGNKTTAGLTLTVTATTAGQAGAIKLTQGIGTEFNNLLTSILEPTTGDIATAESAINTDITNNQTQITSINNQVTNQTQMLQTMFSTMETQISQLQSQGQAFAAQAAALTGGEAANSSSSSSSSSSSL